MALRTWTEDQLAILKKEYPTIREPRELAPMFNKTFTAVKSMAKKMGIRRKTYNSNYGRTKATPADDKFIKENFLLLPVNQLAFILGYSETLIIDRMRHLKLRVPKKIRQARKHSRCFKKGNAPMNKGKKQKDYMSREAIARTAATRFKKGNVPPNTKFDNAVVIRHEKYKDGTQRPYKWIRISKAKWRMLHVVNWEKANGPVPKGSIIVFKDKNSMNTEIGNLECITLKQNMMRNSASLRLTDNYVAFTIVGKNHMDLYDEVKKNKPLIELKKQSIILKRTINERERDTAEA